jgi:hypothetical protein
MGLFMSAPWRRFAGRLSVIWEWRQLGFADCSLLLNHWTWLIRVGAKHAAFAGSGSEDGTAMLALIKELAPVSGHYLFLRGMAIGTGYDRIQIDHW